MDKQEYLNQISPESALPKPVQPSLLDKILKSKFTWIGLGAVILLVIIMGVGAVLQANKPNPVQKISELTLVIQNTNDIVDEYQASLKSSQLRGYSASLGSVLADTEGKLDSYITVNLKTKKVATAAAIAAANQEKATITQELDDAIINGYLDKTYAIKIAYLISVITARENEVLKMTSGPIIQEILTTSEESLQKLYDEFHDFKGIN